MHCSYDDIRDRIKDEPLWFDENAVPRYVPFSPRYISDIYAEEAALVEIACQDCHKKFLVAFSRSVMDDIFGGPSATTLANMIRKKIIHYGDPPNIRCCPSGPTMNSDPLRVIEFWERNNLEWVRNKSLEIDVSD